MLVHHATEDTGAPISNSLAVALHLLNMLPTLPANFTFNAAAPLLTSFVPEVYASQPWLILNSLNLMHTPPPQSDHMAIDMLKDEIICHATATAAAASRQLPMSTPPVLPDAANSDGQEDEVGTRNSTAK